MGNVTLKTGSIISKKEERSQAEEILDEVAGIEESAAQEVQSVNNISNFLSDLGGTGAQQAYQKYLSVVNRTSEIEEDVFKLPFHISNIKWDHLCQLHSDLFNIIEPGSGETRAENTLLLSEKTDKQNARNVVVNANTLIPYIEGADTLTVITRTSKQINNRGIIFIQEKRGECGIFSFITFEQGKKIVGFYTVSGNPLTRQFYYIGHVKSEDPIPSVSIPTTATLRSLTSTLTEEDKIRITNSSQRFGKRIDDLTTVGDIIKITNESLTNTVDYSYVNKLMTINRDLSYITA